MERKLKVLYKEIKKSAYKAINGSILSVINTPCGDEIVVLDGGEKGRKQCIIEVKRGDGGFAFFACAASGKMPVYYPEEGVAITTCDDERGYSEIESYIKGKNLKTDVERFEEDAETSFSSVEKLPSRHCPTFLSVFGNVNLWEAGFRGFPIEEKQHFDLYDYFIPRQNWDRVDFDDKAERVVYRYSFGKGMGAREDLKRKNLKGYYPCLIAELPEDGIKYSVAAFCDSESDYETDCGTNAENAMLHSASNSLTEEEKNEAKKLESGKTILRVKLSAVNCGESSAVAYFRLPQINTPVMAESDKLNEEISNGYGLYNNRAYMRATVDGEKANGAELAFFLAPKERKDIYLILFFTPKDIDFAEKFNENDFEKRLKVAEKFWKNKLGDLSDLKLPEKRIENAVKTGYYHLLGSCFGERGGSVYAPCVGVYPPIGSESTPIIQFFESVGQNDFAGKCIDFFFMREKENGFIQNICGYMIENGATLYNESLHFEYTRDRKRLSENFGKIRKSVDYITDWIDRNKNDKPLGYGMIDGQVADPEDTFRSYSLNAVACAGLNGAAKMYGAYLGEDNPETKRVKLYASELTQNIRKAYKNALKRSPLVPLKDGRWTPSVAPWAEGRCACSLHFNGESCFSHAGQILKDSLLSVGFMPYYGVFDYNSEETKKIIDYLTDSYFTDNTAYSQPYYNLIPMVSLKRGERKAFLKEYYTAFATLADRETYSFWEHYFLATPHKTHEQGWFLMRTRYMLYLERDNCLYLLSGIPEKWRKNGKKIVLKNAACLYGKFSLKVCFGKSGTRVEFDGDFSNIPVYMSINGKFERLSNYDGKAEIFGGE